MAASRKRQSASVQAAVRALAGKSVAVGLSGGVDSVVLLHALESAGAKVSAVHVNHGISPNARKWERFCSGFCSSLSVPLEIHRVKVVRKILGLEAAAREARRAAMLKSTAKTISLAHNQDDQAETVLLNLLRGTGLAGAKGMSKEGKLGKKRIVRPLLGVSRAEIVAYARAHRLQWIEDESNDDTALTRNFLRHRVGPLLAEKFPRWQSSLARAARHFAAAGVDEARLLRAFLAEQGVRAPSEARLGEMLKQLRAGKAEVAHEGRVLRSYRGRVTLEKPALASAFKAKAWKGQPIVSLPELGGELHFRKVRGKGIDPRLPLEIRLRSGGEKMQLDSRRPRRTLKNLFQEAGIPPWQRERLPLLYSGDELVWVPGLGLDVRFRISGRSAGIEPSWLPA
jgi:tRNA(Ile)-lysidine synthase